MPSKNSKPNEHSLLGDQEKLYLTQGGRWLGEAEEQYRDLKSGEYQHLWREEKK